MRVPAAPSRRGTNFRWRRARDWLPLPRFPPASAIKQPAGNVQAAARWFTTRESLRRRPSASLHHLPRRWQLRRQLAGAKRLQTQKKPGVFTQDRADSSRRYLGRSEKSRD